MKSTDISLDRQASSASVIKKTIIIMKSTDCQAKYPSISL